MAGPDTRPPADGGGAAEAEAAGGGFLSRWSRRKALVRQGGMPAEPVAAADLVAPAAPTAQPGNDRAADRIADPAADPARAALPPTDALPRSPQPQPQPEAPTLADVDLLNRDSDYARFVQPGVDASVRNAALKKLFSDPHFNLMDRLDTYIDDYGLPDPLPAGMLRQMVQSHALGLFDAAADETAAATEPAAATAAEPAEPTESAAPTDPTDPDTAPGPAPDPTPEPLPEPIQAPDEDPDLRLQPHPAAGPAGPGTGAVPDPRREH